MSRFKLQDSPEWTILTEVPDRIEKVVSEYRKKVRAIQTDTRLTPQAKQADLDKLRETFIKNDLGTIRKTVEGVTGDLRKQLNVAKPVTTDVNELLLAELREQRAWARVKPLLDAAKDIAPVVQKLAEQRDPATIAALRTELPFYAELRDPGPNPTLWPALETVINEGSLSFEDRMNRQVVAELERGVGLVQSSFYDVEQSLTRTNLTGEFLLTGVDGTVRTVKADVEPATGHAIPSGGAAD